MKVSQIIKDIVTTAEMNFGISDHNNDTISVGMYYTGEQWQVWLQRPSKGQLDCGEVYHIDTIKKYEYDHAFMVLGSSLMQALESLQDEIAWAYRWPE